MRPSKRDDTSAGPAQEQTRFRRLAGPLVGLVALVLFGGVAAVGACPAPEVWFEGDDSPRHVTFSASEQPLDITITGTGWICSEDMAGFAGCGSGGDDPDAYDEVVFGLASSLSGDVTGTRLGRVVPEDDGTFRAELTIDGLKPGRYWIVAQATSEGFSNRISFALKRT